LDFGLRENVRADEKLTAFLELESAIREFNRSSIPACALMQTPAKDFHIVNFRLLRFCDQSEVYIRD
jgi:hypothetical protein